MDKETRTDERRIPSVAAFLVVLFVSVGLAFALGVILGRLWGGGSAEALPVAVASPTGSEVGADTGSTERSTGEEEAWVATETLVPISTPVEPTEVVASPVSAEPRPSSSPPTGTPMAFSEGPFVIGESANGNDLVAYRLGTGSSARALIGGIHGGYEWNTIELVSETLKHLQQTPAVIPDDVTLYVIPCANPDGYRAGTDAIHGRVNGNDVDLNRNWDYQHQMTATHGTRPIFAGNYAFSEPETQALRDFIHERDIELAIFYHSAMFKVFSGAERHKCATFEFAEYMSDVTGYPHAPEGVPGQITTGDAIDYLSKVGITAIEIELTNHQDIDWERNWRGVKAFLEWEIPRTERAFIEHEVQPGETLLALAIMYDVTEEAILAANEGILDPDQIIAGTTILIPTAQTD